MATRKKSAARVSKKPVNRSKVAKAGWATRRANASKLKA